MEDRCAHLKHWPTAPSAYGLDVTALAGRLLRRDMLITSTTMRGEGTRTLA